MTQMSHTSQDKSDADKFDLSIDGLKKYFKLITTKHLDPAREEEEKRIDSPAECDKTPKLTPEEQKRKFERTRQKIANRKYSPKEKKSGKKRPRSADKTKTGPALKRRQLINDAKSEGQYLLDLKQNIPQRMELWITSSSSKDKKYTLEETEECIADSKALRALFSTVLLFGNGGIKTMKSFPRANKRIYDDNTRLDPLYECLKEDNPKLLDFMHEWLSSADSSVILIFGVLQRLLRIFRVTLDGKPTDIDAVKSKIYQQVKKEQHELKKELKELVLFLNKEWKTTDLFLETLNRFKEEWKFTMTSREKRRGFEEEKKRKMEEERKKR